MTDSACFRCPLPDCDERSKGCLLRQAANQHSHIRKHAGSEAIPPEVRAAYNEHFHIWKLDDLARKSERQSDR
ncbi:hypothetical protein [Aureimonas sp. ME7]|uniref:hypothetical protein n=1 Tax=Aureimonas sp. ME7 TaxID=2744252 RepID=UPI0015F5DEDC|nr:hypothetical protein [Aureimonas sp. ME7]